MGLDLGANQLSGEIPPELGNLSNLKVLDLFENKLSGETPSELGNLSNLQVLRLYSNGLGGSIPSELGNLTSLEWLYLGDNQLSGAVPVELGSLPNLTQLGLPGNQLTPCVQDTARQVPVNVLKLYSCRSVQDLTLFIPQSRAPKYTTTTYLSCLSQRSWRTIHLCVMRRVFSSSIRR